MGKIERKRAAERQRAKHWFKRVMRFIRTDTSWVITLHKIDKESPVRRVLHEKRCLAGYCRPRWRLILIDPRYDVLSTGIHECLHVLDWSLAEREVVKLENLIMKHLSDEETEALHIALAGRFS